MSRGNQRSAPGTCQPQSFPVPSLQPCLLRLQGEEHPETNTTAAEAREGQDGTGVVRSLSWRSALSWAHLPWGSHASLHRGERAASWCCLLATSRPPWLSAAGVVLAELGVPFPRTLDT